jgi:hypothetical protein
MSLSLQQKPSDESRRFNEGLRESPFLNVYPDAKVRGTLELMKRQPDERVTEASTFISAPQNEHNKGSISLTLLINLAQLSRACRVKSSTGSSPPSLDIAPVSSPALRRLPRAELAYQPQ